MRTAILLGASTLYVCAAFANGFDTVAMCLGIAAISFVDNVLYDLMTYTNE